MGWHEFLTLTAVALAGGTVLWLIVVRRTLFDPRVFVLGGLFHWVLVSQVITTFRIAEIDFGFDPYEANPGFKPESYIVVDALIVASIVVFLLGFAFGRRLAPKAARPAATVIRTGRLAALTCVVGVAGILFFRTAELNPTLPAELVLPLTYLMPAASVPALFLLLSKAKNQISDRWRIPTWAGAVLLILPLTTLLRTNMALVYPLIALLFFTVNRDGLLRPQAPRTMVIGLLVFVPVALVLQACVKAYNVLEGIMDLPMLDMLASGQYWSRVDKQFSTFDVFNAESYSVLVHLYELYAAPGNYKWGMTLLAAFPLFKVMWREELKGLGRRFILDIYGVDAPYTTALAISPVGELLVNFSFLGVLIFYFAIGMVGAIYYSRLRSSPSPALYLLYPPFLTWLFVQQRGDFPNGNMYPAYVVTIGYALIRWSERPLSQLHRKQVAEASTRTPRATP